MEAAVNEVPEVVRAAVAPLGHTVVWSPMGALPRWTCTVCGCPVVLRFGDREPYGSAMVDRCTTAEELAVELDPRAAADSAEFAVRWWAAWMFVPVVSWNGIDTPSELATARPVTWLGSGVLRLDSVRFFVRQARARIGVYLSVVNEVTVHTESGQPLLDGGHGGPLAPVPTAVREAFPAQTVMRVGRREVSVARADEAWQVVWRASS